MMLERLLTVADEVGQIDWSLSVGFHDRSRAELENSVRFPNKQLARPR